MPGPPLVIVTVAVELSHAVLDCTDESIHERFGTSYQELTGTWRYDETPATWRLGVAAYASGVVAGIRYPSARAGTEDIHDNLVLFRDRVVADPTARLYVYDPDRDLPPSVANIRPRWRRYRT